MLPSFEKLPRRRSAAAALRGSDAVGAHPIQPREVRLAGVIGGEQHILAVGGPADGETAGGFPGQAPRHAASALITYTSVRPCARVE